MTKADWVVMLLMQTATEMNMDYTFVNRLLKDVKASGTAVADVFGAAEKINPLWRGLVNAAEENARKYSNCTENFFRRKIDIVSTESLCYPANLKKRLGEKTPPCFFAAGNLELGTKPAISVTGVRDTLPDDIAFARRLGELCAKEGFVVVSGGAVGVDSEVLSATLKKGGETVVYLPQGFEKSVFMHQNRSFIERGTLLCLSLWKPAESFTGNKALERNVYIHSHGDITVTVRAKLKSGGSWSGACYNLERGRTPAYVSDIPSPGNEALRKMGAGLIKREELFCPDFRLKEEITELRGFGINPFCEI